MFAERVNPEKIKTMLKDVPELNVILSYEEQFEDEDIFTAAENAEDEVFARFPVLRSRKIPEIAINYMTISYLLSSIASLELRNQMHINDNNVGGIDYSNKFPQYQQLSQQYKQEAISMLQSIAANNYFTEMWGSESSISYSFEGGEE